MYLNMCPYKFFTWSWLLFYRNELFSINISKISKWSILRIFHTINSCGGMENSSLLLWLKLAHQWDLMLLGLVCKRHPSFCSSYIKSKISMTKKASFCFWCHVAAIILNCQNVLEKLCQLYCSTDVCNILIILIIVNNFETL